jgi:hypothetical protein
MVVEIIDKKSGTVEHVSIDRHRKTRKLQPKQQELIVNHKPNTGHDASEEGSFLKPPIRPIGQKRRRRHDPRLDRKNTRQWLKSTSLTMFVY